MFELCLIQVFSSFEFKIARAKILLETFSELYANKGDIILEFFFGFQGYANKGDIILEFFFRISRLSFWILSFQHVV